MRITFVIQDLFGCGAQYVTALLVRGFVARGYEVDLIVSSYHKKLLAKGDVRPFEVPSKTNWIILPCEKARNNLFALIAYLRQTDSGAVFAMSSNYTTALGVAAFFTKRHPQLIHVEHSGWTGVLSRKRKMDVFWDKLVFSRYAKVIGVSAGTARGFKESHPSFRGVVATVYNPVIDKVFWSKKSSGDPIHSWLEDKEIPTFIAAGSYTPLKKHLLLFEAILQCQKKRKVRLILYGRGALNHTYKQYVKNHNAEQLIDIAGYTDSLPLMLSHATGLIVSSEVESFSVVIVEALACGTPVISTNCPFGPHEILENGRFGSLVPVNDVDAMSDAILAIAEGKRYDVPEWAWKRFDVENVVKEYEKVIKQK